MLPAYFWEFFLAVSIITFIMYCALTVGKFLDENRDAASLKAHSNDKKNTMNEI